MVGGQYLFGGIDVGEWIDVLGFYVVIHNCGGREKFEVVVAMVLTLLYEWWVGEIG